MMLYRMTRPDETTWTAELNEVAAVAEVWAGNTVSVVGPSTAAQRVNAVREVVSLISRADLITDDQYAWATELMRHWKITATELGDLGNQPVAR